MITNYTDLNGPSTKADSSVVVIVNKDGSLSVDQNLLGTLMGTDGTQGAISVVRVGHEGKPDDATDSETEDDKVHHVTLSVDSYYDEPNSIIKYDSGAEMLQSLRIETRENSLVGFQNDHCYTPLISPSQELPKRSDSMIPYEESVIEIMQTPPPPPPKSLSNSKKITILEQQIISKGKKIVINSTQSPVILKGRDVLNKPLPVTKKGKDAKSIDKDEGHLKLDDNVESSSTSSSGESMPDRDSDSDYRETKDRTGSIRLRKTKLKPRILKGAHSTKISKLDVKTTPRLKANKNIVKKENKEKVAHQKSNTEHKDGDVDLESLLPINKISTVHEVTPKEISKVVIKQTPKPIKKEKKTPAHVTALLSDMTSLFSTPDVIRRVSTETKTPIKEALHSDKKPVSTPKLEVKEETMTDAKPIENIDKNKILTVPKAVNKPKEKAVSETEKITKPYDSIPQLDEVSLAHILQDTRSAPSNTAKALPSISSGNAINSPGLVGPLSPTLDLLGGLQPEEEGLTEDLLMHVAQLVESSENLQEVIDKQVLGKVDSTAKNAAQLSFQQAHGTNLYTQTLSKTVQKNIPPRKDPIEIVRRDGRIIKLPPIEAPATRSSKRKSQVNEAPVTTNDVGAIEPNAVHTPLQITPEPQVPVVSKQYVNKKLTSKKQESLLDTSIVEKISAESQESWNSEDDPNRLWCICKQPHNNRFMICCDSCEDWFHGKCVNITKAMGQQMEEQGIEWRCPNCIKKAKATPKTSNKIPMSQKKHETEVIANEIKSLPAKELTSKTSCIVCKKPARASSIYCSDSCILKHAQDSLGGNQNTNNKDEGETGKSQDNQKSESRVIVYERKSGRLLAGPNAPTAENLKAWLQKNPTFEVVRPGTLSTIKPNTSKKKNSNEPNRIQTTLNFERIPRKSLEQTTPSKSQQVEVKEKINKSLPSPKEEVKTVIQPKTPVASKSHQQTTLTDSPKGNSSVSTAKPVIEPRKIVRNISSRSQSTNEKSPVTTPPISRRKEVLENRIRMNSDESIRDNVKKSLQEQMVIRMAETKGSKLTDEEIKQFAVDTESEMHDLFRDVGMKYKAKYRSLIFNIKDRKNLSLWEKICDKSLTPKQLVRLSPEELASQELAQWRDKEAKHQLELIKKSELDLLAASKTYVLKTHKGEEVMETKESVSTELDPNVPVEDVVSVLNDTINEEPPPEKTPSPAAKIHKVEKKRNSSRKRERESSSSRQSKRSKRDSEKKSRSSRRRKSGSREKESKEVQRRSTRRSDRKTSRSRSISRDRTKSDTKDSRSDVGDRSRHRSKSKEKSTRRSKSRVNSRSSSKVRDRSKSHERTRRRSQSRESSKQRRSSRSKRNSISTDEKFKQRSRSQEITYDKSKNDSTDSDSVERPKSAMLKEVHPEYDPHEPMITSAFSEEDLRKSRDDVYEENYENDIKDVGTEYDPSKSFALSTGVTMPSSVYMGKQDQLSAEAESDQEPSSTVENAAATVWNGCINMVDVARFYVAAHEVSGSAVDLEEDLTTELDIVGRINPDTVWDYIGKTKKASNKDIVILRLQAANDEEKMQYIALYSYLSSRNRLGVVKVSSTTTVKDFYIVPLPANTNLPAVLLPLDGPGIGEVKTHLLLGIVIRQRKKRLAPHIPKDVIPAKVARESQKRSYTPPMLSKGTHTPPSSPKRRAPLPLPQYSSTALSNTVKDKIAASLACAGDDEAYSPDSSSSNGSVSLPTQSTGSSNTLRSKMEELNRQIEEQKQQIFKMAQANNSAGEDEAYSPSRPMTPSPPVVPLADIALPSNLQEILATIKQRSETVTGDVDMRTMPLP